MNILQWLSSYTLGNRQPHAEHGMITSMIVRRSGNDVVITARLSPCKLNGYRKRFVFQTSFQSWLLSASTLADYLSTQT